MKSQFWNCLTQALCILAMLVAVLGCSRTIDTGPSAEAPAPTPEAVTQNGHNLDGWWCGEHGLPEDECSLCSSEAAEKFKAKGDWCVEHDRADSQCFIHHPELEAKFAARYEAKFGKKPPKPTDSQQPK